jgi:predicted Zn-dependent protease
MIIALLFPFYGSAEIKTWLYQDEWRYNKYEFIFKYKMPIHKDHQDYFEKDTNPAAKRMLYDLEHHHYGPIFFEPLLKSNYKEAFNQIKFIFVYMPNHPKALAHIAQIGVMLGNKALAIPYFQTAIERFPQHSFTHAQYGDYLVNIGYTAHGIKKIEKAISIDKDKYIYYRMLSNAYLKAGNPALAEKAKQKMQYYKQKQ